MRPIIYKMSALLAALVIVSCGKAAAQDKATLAVLVVNANSAEGPAEGAIVLLTRLGGKQRLSVTNADGTCRFSSVDPGDYSLKIIQRAFFVAPELEERLSAVSISKGEQPSINVRLIKGAVLTGRIVGPTGAPIVGLPVTAMSFNEKSRKTVLPSEAESNVTSTSNDRGEFRIYGLREGSYVLGVNAQRSSYRLKSVPTLYYPAHSELRQATVFDLVPNQVTTVPDMTIDLRNKNQSSLLVSVVGQDSTPLAAVSLTLASTDGGQVSDFGVTDERGSVNFEGLPQGKYTVKANPGKGSYLSIEREVVVKGPTGGHITLELREYPTITGQTYFRSKNEVRVLPSVEIALVPAKVDQAVRFASDENGSFKVRTGFVGDFWWTFPRLRRQDHVEKITLNGKDITFKPLRLDRISDLKGISVQFAAGGATITGQFGEQDPAGCSRYAVYAVAMKASGNGILYLKKADVCEKGNSFGLYSLSPGRYYVIALLLPAKEIAGGSQTRFQGIDDSNSHLIEQAVVRFETAGSDRKGLVITSGQTYENVVPVILDLSVESRRQRKSL